MGSIYNTADNEAIIARINSLSPDSKSLWGKMTVDQMCQHCNAAMQVAFGQKELKINFLLRLLGRMIKNKAFNSDFGKNSPTAKELKCEGSYDFETSRKEFAENFSQFAKGTQTIKVLYHPFWGKMTYEDWDKLMWRHTDHHLRQFGV
ncbi:DUF1569 domain-containing protein [Flavobacterium gilvum]|uniref:DUF1569 domain-containing protein n=1 Tax=Flavobacterium gilvum TaxID=1492737 RepID=A0AAC9I2S7_9FLAO|nr:DUF1569 domain-containing protein [Flavobacterium gilvum]AOW09684.1 hypothetical protein EM308_09295 [Flavobacterium gilvum]KFC60785.1 hypothetical protein FEM08_04270 [Flavobacterium gilvum]